MPNLPVEALVISPQAEMNQGLSVYGEPLHCRTDVLLDMFKSLPLAEFMAHQARHGIGNYALVETKGTQHRIITSPGYCGGYFYSTSGTFVCSTLLAPCVAAIPSVQMDPFPICFFLGHAPDSAFNSLPLSTVFRNVTRLPPASHLLRRGHTSVLRSYLNRIGELAPAASFEKALDEVTTAMARHYGETGQSPALMFSGGVDSLIVYLALRQKMSADQIRVFTMDHSASNGPMRALPVAEKLGIDVNLLSSEALRSERGTTALLDLMRKDIIATKAPHHVFAEHPIGPVDIIHGQNMDAMANNNMLTLHANLEKGFLSDQKGSLKSGSAAELRQLKAFIGNLQFTPGYLDDPAFQRTTSKFFAAMINGKADPKPGAGGILRGMFSTQTPNVLGKYTGPGSQIAALSNEAEKFEAFAPQIIDRPSLAADFARFFTYSAIANKRASSTAISDGCRTLFVAMSGPISSYFLTRDRGLSSASRPKAEIYDLAERMSGQPYSKLISTKKPAPKESALSPAPDSLVERAREYLDAGSSRVIAATKEISIKDHLTDVYEETASSSHPDAQNFTLYNQSRARQIINLELVLKAERE